MTAADFEQHLRRLDRTATPVRRRPDRETWRFEVDGKGYFLHFFPGDGRLSRGPAAREFAALKALQTAGVPAVRAAALLSGFRFGDRKGDAVLTHAVEPAVRPDTLPPSRRAAVRARVIDWLAGLAKAGLGHGDLSPSAFLWAGDAVVLADAVGLTNDGLRREHLTQFAHAAGDLATTPDRVRAWRRLVDADVTPPPDRSARARFRRDVARDAVESTRLGEWAATFRATAPASMASPWSTAARLLVTRADWQREWPRLLGLIRADGLDVLKRDGSGDVLAATVTLAGVPVDAIVKRPRNKFWYRYVWDAFRASKARRAWRSTQAMQLRGLASEYPLAVFDRRVAGYPVESVGVYERVPGPTLEAYDLDALTPADRESLFRRCGRALRRIESTGLAHPDAKSSNWIVYADQDADARPPVPIMIDLYGVRPLTATLQLAGVKRLLRAMRHHPQYTPADSLRLCQGFAPRTRPELDDAE